MTIEKVLEKIARIAPLELAEQWDNVGLLIDCLSNTLNQRVLLTNDFSEKVLEECISKQVGLVISYHPPIFTPLKRFVQSNWKERLLIRTIQAGISLYSPHTALDCCSNGVNDWIASWFSTIGYESVPLQKHPKGPEGTGMGRILKLNKRISPELAVQLTKQKLNLPNVRCAVPTTKGFGWKEEWIGVIAVCAGAGVSLFRDYVDCPTNTQHIDLFVTGEAGHHFAFDCIERSSCLILTEHSNSERGYLRDVLVHQLGEDCLVSETDCDPLSVV